ncbi:MAG: glycoside hydrolase family 25 protein [Ruminococcus sp.]|jgi:GH25 family lysozyme M1 (1,4-beta-N-acetylmuramidase)|nr:glycoside hydrolase family 25 protein [Ruminococcus sp.]
MNDEYNNKTKIIRAAIGALLGALLISTAVLAFALINSKEETANEQGKNAALAAMAQATPKDFTYPDSTDVVTLKDAYLGEISIPAISSVPKAAYDYDDLVYENGRYTYVQDGFVTSYTGIDVSRHNGDIDWEAVAADGIDFAIIRVGYRGYSEGVMQDDSKFTENIEGALAAGIPVGVYYYSQAISVNEAREEAAYVVEKIAPYEITYPVVFDVEITEAGEDGDFPRQNEISGSDLTDVANAFCEHIRDAGYTPMIYANLRMAYLKLDMRRLAGWDFWISEWRDEEHDPSFYYDYQIWQYASDGQVAGIDGDVDMNICFAHYEDLIKEMQSQANS